MYVPVIYICPIYMCVYIYICVCVCVCIHIKRLPAS